MIIRKPYAFLIKYFKIIHIVLFFFMLYLVFKTRSLYMFFRNFLITGTYTYKSNMALSYINIPMILMTIFLIAMLLLIYFLMKQKEKNVLYYLLATIFYSISFIIYLFFITVFNNLEFSSYSNQALVIFRDLSMVIYYLNYIFLVVSFIRGFGFNIKKFNFEKDLKELEISDEDREEIEVGNVIDYENVGNFLRRRKRNFIYYLKENSFILIIFTIIGIMLISTSIVLSKLVINKEYIIGEIVPINSINYKVNNAFVVNKDANGLIIKNNKYYLIVDLDIINTSNDNIKPNMNNTRIKIDNNYYYLKNNVTSVFNEFGKLYKTEVIKSKANDNYILVFEIDKNIKNATLELYDGKRVNGGEVTLYYKNVILSLDAFSNNDLGSYKIKESIDLSKTYYKRGTFKVINYQFLDIEKYAYKKCITDNNCQEYSKEIVPSNNNKLLKIQYELSINKNIFNYLNIDQENKITNDKIKNITPSNYYENTVLLEVPNNISDDINLLFDIRNTIFRVK